MALIRPSSRNLLLLSRTAYPKLNVAYPSLLCQERFYYLNYPTWYPPSAGIGNQIRSVTHKTKIGDPIELIWLAQYARSKLENVGAEQPHYFALNHGNAQPTLTWFWMTYYGLYLHTMQITYILWDLTEDMVLLQRSLQITPFNKHLRLTRSLYSYRSTTQEIDKLSKDLTRIERVMRYLNWNPLALKADVHLYALAQLRFADQKRRKVQRREKRVRAQNILQVGSGMDNNHTKESQMQTTPLGTEALMGPQVCFADMKWIRSRWSGWSDRWIVAGLNHSIVGLIERTRSSLRPVRKLVQRSCAWPWSSFSLGRRGQFQRAWQDQLRFKLSQVSPMALEVSELVRELSALRYWRMYQYSDGITTAEIAQGRALFQEEQLRRFHVHFDSLDADWLENASLLQLKLELPRSPRALEMSSLAEMTLLSDQIIRAKARAALVHTDRLLRLKRQNERLRP